MNRIEVLSSVPSPSPLLAPHCLPFILLRSFSLFYSHVFFHVLSFRFLWVWRVDNRFSLSPGTVIGSVNHLTRSCSLWFNGYFFSMEIKSRRQATLSFVFSDTPVPCSHSILPCCVSPSCLKILKIENSCNTFHV